MLENVDNPYFCSIESSFLEDRFNLVGTECYLKYQVEAYSILINGLPKNNSKTKASWLEEAYMLYGMLHARYILTSAGLAQLATKYEKGIYGRCPRVQCKEQRLLPIGLCSIPKVDDVNHYCCMCEDVYSMPTPDSVQCADGAFFGQTYIHLFFRGYLNKLPTSPLGTYTPRLFGFKTKKFSDENKERKRICKAVNLKISHYNQSTLCKSS